MMIELNDVQYAYPEANQKLALNVQHWSVKANEQVFVHGPSGCGKSTLLNILSGMLLPTQGEISVLGEQLHAMNNRRRDQFRAKHIGYVFQQFNLIPYLDAINNIELASYFTKVPNQANKTEAIKTLLSDLNIASSEWKKPVSKLSTGQQQRIAIARALINKPELLIADEPTSSLDHQNRDNFMALLMQLSSNNQSTLIFVSHDMALASYFSRVDHLNDFNKLEVK